MDQLNCIATKLLEKQTIKTDNKKGVDVKSTPKTSAPFKNYLIICLKQTHVRTITLSF